MTRRWRCIKRKEVGASLVEYALLIAMIALVCLGALSFLGSQTHKPYNSVGSVISSSS